VPVLASVRAVGAVDLVTVRLVTGQAPEAFTDKTPNLAHAFDAQLCRVRESRPGLVTLEFVRSDTLADPIPALPVGPAVNLAAVAAWIEDYSHVRRHSALGMRSPVDYERWLAGKDAA
jgi:S-DNA-T family DNA segregation ATPase FtsK/SpoIIIE